MRRCNHAYIPVPDYAAERRGLTVPSGHRVVECEHCDHFKTVPVRTTPTTQRPLKEDLHAY